MAQALGQGSTPSLAEIEPLLREVSRVYHLGVHLEVPTEQLKHFERDYSRDTARQRTEVLTYWRDNCSDATWERLAAAVEKLGGHGNLVRRLRGLALESSRQDGDVAGDFSTPPRSPVASNHSHTEDIDVFEHVSALPLVAAGSTVTTGELDESSLASATKKLKLDFTSLFTSVRLSLEKLQVTPESVLCHLKSIEAIESDIEAVYVSKSETFVKTLSKKIRSLAELFLAILPYCSWFNHLLVENIIETFCDDDERLLRKWERFKESFAKYCESRLCQCPLDQFGEDHPHADTTPVVMKIDNKWKTVKVAQLEVIRDTVAQILNIKLHNLYLRAVKNGCIELTFYIPNFIATGSLPPSTEQITALQNEGISLIQYARVWALAIGDADKIDDLMEMVMREVEVREKTAESAGKDIEIHQLQQELEHEQAERTRAEEQLQETRTQLQQKTSELEREQVERTRALRQKDALIQEKTSELEREQIERTRAGEHLRAVNINLQQIMNQLQQTDALIRQKTTELEREQADRATTENKLQAQLMQKDSQIEQQTRELEQQTVELNSVQQSLRRLRAELEEREARLRAQEEEMQQRDAEINRLMGEQQHQKLFIELEDKEALLKPLENKLQRQIEELCRIMKEGSHFEKQSLSEKLLIVLKEGEAISRLKENEEAQLQTPLAELKIPLKLECRSGREMPFDMGGSIQAVAIGDVFVGGGESLAKAAIVMVYSVQTCSWRILPPGETYWFGMAAVNNQLVLVGGKSTSTGRVTNVLVAWDEMSRTWTRPFPMMPTARLSPSAISYKKWLIVAGGRDERNSLLNKVELLDTVSGQWHEGSPLPTKCSSMSSAINGNMWYLSGGRSSEGANKHVFSVCLDELISQAISQSAGSTSSPWQTLPEPPLTQSTVLILNGALLTVGGVDSSSIHLYQPGRRSWVKVGDLPEQRWGCACTVLPNGEMFVAGGRMLLNYDNLVYIASIV